MWKSIHPFRCYANASDFNAPCGGHGPPSCEESALVVTGVTYGRRGSRDKAELREFYCPAHKCIYNESGCRCFKSMKLLKQHYLKVHAEKKFVCPKCQFGFGIERDYKRHLSTCGVIYACVTCGCPYSTKEALQMHCRRKQHQLPADVGCKRSRQCPETEATECSASGGIRCTGSAGREPTQSPGAPGSSPSLLLSLLPSRDSTRPVNVGAPTQAERRLVWLMCGSPGGSSLPPLSLPAGPKLRRIMPKVVAAAAAAAPPSSAVRPLDAAERLEGTGRRRSRKDAKQPIHAQAGMHLVVPGTSDGADDSPLTSTASGAAAGRMPAPRAGARADATLAGAHGDAETPACIGGGGSGSGRDEAEASVSTFGPAVDTETQTLLDELSSITENMSTQTFSSFLLNYRLPASPRPSVDTSASGTQTDWSLLLPLSSPPPGATLSLPTAAALLLAPDDGSADDGRPTAEPSPRPIRAVLPLRLPPLDEGAGVTALQRGYLLASSDGQRMAAATAAAQQFHEQYCHMTESETQTLLDELSTFTENMSTQTFDSFLFDSHSATSFGTQTQLLAEDDDERDVPDAAARSAALRAGVSDATPPGAAAASGGSSRSLLQPPPCLPLLAGERRSGHSKAGNDRPSSAGLYSEEVLNQIGGSANGLAAACNGLHLNGGGGGGGGGAATAALAAVSRCQCLIGACSCTLSSTTLQASEPSLASCSRQRASDCDEDRRVAHHSVASHGYQAMVGSLDDVATDFSGSGFELCPAACLRGVDAAMQTNFDGDPSGALYRQMSTQTMDLGDIFVSMETQTVDLAVQTWTQTEDHWTLF